MIFLEQSQLLRHFPLSINNPVYFVGIRNIISNHTTHRKRVGYNQWHNEGPRCAERAKSSFECGKILKNLTEVLAKLHVWFKKHVFLEILPVFLYNHLICSIFFREGHEKGRGCQQGQGALFFARGGGGGVTGNITPLATMSILLTILIGKSVSNSIYTIK